ncbi:MAG: TraR/DksA C4-type zinc finger protein, partial [Thermodesulfobacteriota bacterium]|nr:TraR/DksA C4-type zinc finger protein [Thermodesulfobacteriota bacterium]
DDELFKVQEVRVEIPASDLPGRPIRRVQCESCGDYVQDCREVEKDDGKVLCRACAHGAYYKVL